MLVGGRGCGQPIGRETIRRFDPGSREILIPNIPTRTPEGDPNRCPVCGHRVRVEPACLTPDAPCSHCGTLLWFDAPRALAETPLQQTIAMLLACGEMRFGLTDAAAREAIAAIGDEETARALIEPIVACASWNDFLSRIPDARRFAAG
jgi:hypothetical protein